MDSSHPIPIQPDVLFCKLLKVAISVNQNTNQKVGSSFFLCASTIFINKYMSQWSLKKITLHDKPLVNII